jgi:hypothetical protein
MDLPSLQQPSTYVNATLPTPPRIDAEPRSIPPRLQTACKQTRPRIPACSHAGSRRKREVLPSLIVVVGGADGTRASQPRERLTA